MPHLHNKIGRAAGRFAAFYRSHLNWVVGLFVILACAAVVGYQIYAYETSQANKEARTKVTQLTAAQCGSTKFFYTLLNGLVLDTGPHYGSPHGQKIVPGARTKAINELFKRERQTIKPLQAQGCNMSGVIPQDIS